AAPERGLHHEREPDAFGFLRCLVRIDGVRSSGDGGRAGLVGGAPGGRLVAHQQHGLGWWSDEGQPLLRHAPGEIRVLRQESVPWVDHRGAAAMGGMAMTMEGIALRRRFLGVDPEEVERLLTERELELGQLTRQARLAEERAAEAEGRWHALEKRVIESEQRALSAEHELKRLQSMLSSLGLELARREQEAEALRVEADDLRRPLEAALPR